MKILKKILLGLACLLALILLIALFMKKEYAVERSISIAKPKAMVFDYVKSLQKQDEWSPWGKLDPNMKKEFVGTDGTVGFISKWSGNDKVGVGEQEIKKITDGERIDFELRFKEPMESTSPAYLVTEANDDKNTTVKWGMSGKMPYPMNAMMLVMNMEDMIGKDFEAGLASLKTIVEAMPEPVADTSTVKP